MFQINKRDLSDTTAIASVYSKLTERLYVFVYDAEGHELAIMPNGQIIDISIHHLEDDESILGVAYRALTSADR